MVDAKGLDALLDGAEHFVGIGWTVWFAKGHFGSESPCGGKVELFLDGFVDTGVEMLYMHMN